METDRERLFQPPTEPLRLTPDHPPFAFADFDSDEDAELWVRTTTERASHLGLHLQAHGRRVRGAWRVTLTVRAGELQKLLEHREAIVRSPARLAA